MVRIRLSRIGAKKRPFYRVVVTDSTRARGGRSKEVIGTYDPLTEPATIRIVHERALHWLSVGAQPTDTAKYLLEEVGVWADFMKAKGKEYTPKPKSAPAEPVAAPVPEPEPVVEEVVAEAAREEPVAEAPAEESAAETPAESEVPVAEEPASAEEGDAEQQS